MIEIEYKRSMSWKFWKVQSKTTFWIQKIYKNLFRLKFSPTRNEFNFAKVYLLNKSNEQTFEYSIIYHKRHFWFIISKYIICWKIKDFFSFFHKIKSAGEMMNQFIFSNYINKFINKKEKNRLIALDIEKKRIWNQKW